MLNLIHFLSLILAWIKTFFTFLLNVFTNIYHVNSVSMYPSLTFKTYMRHKKGRQKITRLSLYIARHILCNLFLWNLGKMSKKVKALFFFSVFGRFLFFFGGFVKKFEIFGWWDVISVLIPLSPLFCSAFSIRALSLLVSWCIHLYLSQQGAQYTFWARACSA